MEQQLRRRETLGDTYIKPLYALLLHCRTSAVKDCRLGYLQAQPPVYEPGRIVLGALVLLAPDDGNGVPVEVMQNVSGQLIETPRLMEHCAPASSRKRQTCWNRALTVAFLRTANRRTQNELKTHSRLLPFGRAGVFLLL